MMSENDINILARTVWGEARGESDEGKRAIVNVVLNRFKISQKYKKGFWWGNTIEGICLKKAQFSCWNANDPNRKKILDLSYVELKPYIALIKEVLDSGEDNTNGATHYHNLSVCPKWADGEIPCAEVGNHMFYKGIK